MLGTGDTGALTVDSVEMIMSKAQGLIDQKNEQLNSTNNSNNTNTDEDILRRKTQAIPI